MAFLSCANYLSLFAETVKVMPLQIMYLTNGIPLVCQLPLTVTYMNFMSKHYREKFLAQAQELIASNFGDEVCALLEVVRCSLMM
jgi:hypothetical protein